MRLGWRLSTVGASALLLAACTGPTYPVSGPARPPTTPVAPLTVVARQATPIPRPATTVKACGAAELQALIGRPRTDAPVPLDPNRQRVACTSCPAADNVDPGRLNILFDPETGLIAEVRCG